MSKGSGVPGRAVEPNESRPLADHFADVPTADIDRSCDQLHYMADLLSELHGLAGRNGCETLAGLLALSEAEARRQAERIFGTQPER